MKGLGRGEYRVGLELSVRQWLLHTYEDFRHTVHAWRNVVVDNQVRYGHRIFLK